LAKRHLQLAPTRRSSDLNPVIFTEPSGLQHAPGGPWHPDPWINFRCLGTDDCATLSSKIEIFKAVIASHMAWDAQHGVTTHTDRSEEHTSELQSRLNLVC